MMKLIASLTSPFVRKVRIYLAEKNIPYQLVLGLQMTSWRMMLKGMFVALVLTYASLLVTSLGVWTFDDIMGCERACIVKAAGWPVPYFYDYPGMSVGNRVEVDPLSIFVGPDKFRLSGFVPTAIFWALVVCCVGRVRRPRRSEA